MVRDPSRQHILLAEDNPKDEMLMLRALEKYGFKGRVTVVRDGAEAIEHLFGERDNTANALPDIVILDLKLPKVDGLQVLREIRANQRTQCLPVVVLSSSDEQKDISMSYELGANSYLRKPMEFDEFLEMTASLVKYWLHTNHSPLGLR